MVAARQEAARQEAAAARVSKRSGQKANPRTLVPAEAASRMRGLAALTISRSEVAGPQERRSRH